MHICVKKKNKIDFSIELAQLIQFHYYFHVVRKCEN